MSEGLRHTLYASVFFEIYPSVIFLHEKKKKRLLRFRQPLATTRPLCVSGDKSRERWVGETRRKKEGGKEGVVKEYLCAISRTPNS